MPPFSLHKVDFSAKMVKISGNKKASFAQSSVSVKSFFCSKVRFIQPDFFLTSR